MRVLFDHQAFSNQDFGGVSKYFYEMIKNFPVEVEPEVALKYSNNEFIKLLNVAAKPFFAGKSFTGKRYLMNSLNKLYSSRKIKNGDFDILHATFFEPYFITLTSRPKVITVHDLTFEKYPGYFKKYDFSKSSNKQKCLNAADAIVAISENTKNDIIDYYNVPAKKIDVVYHGVNTLPSANLSFKAPDELESSPFILYVGNRRGYKNFNFLVKSIAPLLKKRAGPRLVCIGGGTFTLEEYKLFTSTGVENRIKYFPFSEELLVWLYQNALVFLFPSLYEGFGMPILEAFSNNCPALLSKCSCFPEIAGDAALYFDVNSEESLLSAVTQIVDNVELREECKKKGRERVQLFSWKKSANETLKIYKKLLSNVV